MSTTNRIKCTAKISPMMDKYYTSMAQYDCVAWCMGPSAYETMAAAGVNCFQAESSSARIAGQHAETPFIEYGQAHGVSPDMCSYAKINLGLVLMQLHGKWDQIDPKYRLEPPSCIVAANICPSMMQWAHTLGQLFDVPVFIIDYPFQYDDSVESMTRSAEYIKEQLEELIPFLLKCSGQKDYHMEMLKEQTGYVREISYYQKSIANLMKVVPAPASFIDNAVSMTPAISMRNKQAADFYREFSEEMVERMTKGIGSIENEKYRIMWRGNFPWFKIGFLSRLLSSYDALLVSGAYGMYYLSENPGAKLIKPDGFDLEDPLWTIACNNCVTNYTSSFETKWKAEFAQFIDDFSIDAVIIQAPHTCRPWTLTTREFAKRVDDEYGIPAIVLEADHTDPAYFNDAQVETRIKALLETVDERRTQGRGRRIK